MPIREAIFREAAKVNCADNVSRRNMPVKVSSEDVLAAMKAADRLGSEQA